jgi:uncharacterized RDD family membrane protein YckC
MTSSAHKLSAVVPTSSNPHLVAVPSVVPNIATLARRFSALSIDAALFVGPLYVFAGPRLIEGINTGIFIYPWALVVPLLSAGLLYHTLFLRKSGATLGKMAMGLKVLPIRDGRPSFSQPLTYKQILLRLLFSNVGSYFFSIIPQLFAFFRTDRRQLADLVADTQVVQKTPHNTPPTRHWVLGAILVIFGLNGAVCSLALLRGLSITSQGLVITLNPGKSK